MNNKPSYTHRLSLKLKNPNKPQKAILSLLDFTVKIQQDGNATLDFYKKKAKKPLFVHHKSWLPVSAKKNIIKNEKNRIAQRCSSNKTRKTRIKEFDDVLRLNGYPEEIINLSNFTAQHHRTKKRNQTEERVSAQEQEWLYLSIPYFIDTLDYKLKKNFKKFLKKKALKSAFPIDLETSSLK